MSDVLSQFLGTAESALGNATSGLFSGGTSAGSLFSGGTTAGSAVSTITGGLVGNGESVGSNILGSLESGVSSGGSSLSGLFGSSLSGLFGGSGGSGGIGGILGGLLSGIMGGSSSSESQEPFMSGWSQILINVGLILLGFIVVSHALDLQSNVKQAVQVVTGSAAKIAKTIPVE